MSKVYFILVWYEGKSKVLVCVGCPNPELAHAIVYMGLSLPCTHADELAAEVSHLQRDIRRLSAVKVLSKIWQMKYKVENVKFPISTEV